MTNTVEIILTANDRASTIVEGLATTFDNIATIVSTKIVPSFVKVGTIMSNVFGPVKTGFLEVVTLVNDLDSLLRRFAGTTLPEVGMAITKNLVDSISDASDSTLTEITSAIGSFSKAFAGIEFQQQNPLEGIAQRVIPGYSELLKRAANETATSISSSAAFLANAFDRSLRGLQAQAQDLADSVKTAFSSVGDISIGLSGVDDTIGLFTDIKDAVSPAVEGIAQVGFQIANIQTLLSSLNPIVASGPFKLLIQQNIDLREQLLATQSSLAGTNKVLQGGVEIRDPAAAIKSLQGPVEEAFNRVRKGSLELAGVTSSSLVETFNIVASQAGNIGINLNQAADLTLNFAAALSTLNIPLFQSGQEINSIVNATIDQNSILAKTLKITNDQVRSYSTQGKLVEFLNSRLAAFRAGNAELAKGFSGITSNIQEAVENIGLLAGKNLLDPILRQLQGVLDYLNQNQAGLAQFVQQISENLFGSIENLTKALGGLFGKTDQLIGNSIEIIFNGISSAINGLAESIKVATTIFQPFIAVLTSVSDLVTTFLNPLILFGIQAKVLAVSVDLLSGGFARFAKGLPFVGELLFLMEKRSSGLIGLLTGLNKASGIGAAGFLTLGANLDKIPGLMGIVANKIPFMGDRIAAVIPLLSQFGVAGIAAGQKLNGIVQNVPALATAFNGLGGAFEDIVRGKGGGGLPAAIEKIKEFSQSNELLQPFASVIDDVGTRLQGLAVNANLAEVANRQFAATMIAVRNAIIATVARLALLSIGIYAAFKAFDQFVLKNKELLSTLNAIGQGLLSFARDIANGIISPMGLATIAITGATTALILFSNVIKIQVTQTALAGLIAGLGKVVKSLTTFAAVAGALGATQFATVFSSAAASVSSLSVAAASGTVTVGTLGVALKGLAASAALVAAPLVAIAAGIATAGLARYAKDLADSTQATQILGRASGLVADNALKFTSNLKQVRDEQKKSLDQGVELSKADAERNKILAAQAQLQLQGLDIEIAKLEAQKQRAVGDENRAALQSQIDSLNKVKGAVKAYAAEVELAGDPVFRLGNRLKFVQEQLKRFSLNLDADSKKAQANLAEGLLQGVFTQAEVEDKKVEITRVGYQQQLLETEKGIRELQERYDKLGPEEKDKAKEIQDGITELRAQAADTRVKLAEGEIQQQIKVIERASTKALAVVAEAESQRQILIQQLQNSRQIGESDARALAIQSTKDRIKGELDAEKTKLQELMKNQNANEDAIRASRKRILDLTLESLKAESDGYDAYIARVKSILDKQVTEREIAIQQSVNAGVTTEAQAANERARINAARIKAELAAETRSSSRRRELTLQLAQAERQLQESNLAVLSEALDRQNLAYENAINKQNTELQKQVDLYNNLNEALGTRTRLFEAQKDVQSAAEGFLVSQINGVAALERSERKKQQLAKATAILQYDALLQRQALEDKILETQQQQNLLALQRQQIENQIAQARNDVDIAKAEGSIARGQDELRTGKISQQEFDARVRERDALARAGISLRQQGAIIDSQIAIQPALDAAARQQAELAQASQRSDGLVNIFNNLGRREQRQVRGQLQDFLSQQAGFSNRGELINQGRELGQSFVENVRRGMPDAGLGSFEQFTPRTSAISNMLDRAQGEVPTRQILEAQQDISSSLSSQIEAIRSTTQRVQLENARPLPELQLPGRLPNIEAIRQQQMQSQQPRQLSSEQIQSIANAFWERFSGFGDGVTRDRPNGPNGQPVKVDSINTTINLQDTGEVAKKLAETTQRQLLDTVKKANQLADQRR